MQSVLPRQGLLESEHHMQQILKYVPDNGSAREAVQRAWQSCKGRPADGDINVQRWLKLVDVCEKVSHSVLVPTQVPEGRSCLSTSCVASKPAGTVTVRLQGQGLALTSCTPAYNQFPRRSAALEVLYDAAQIEGSPRALYTMHLGVGTLQNIIASTRHGNSRPCRMCHGRGVGHNRTCTLKVVPKFEGR